MKLILTPLHSIPLIQEGDDLSKITLKALKQNDIHLLDGDILVFAQKIVSKAESRLRNLADVQPTNFADELAEKIKKDPRLVELILQESKAIIRSSPGVLIVEHQCGFICANAGIDRSNVSGPNGQDGDWVLLLPEDSDRSAQEIQNKIQNESNRNAGVLIIDSHSRPWRLGTVGHTIGLANIPAVVDLRGQEDIYAYRLQYSIVGAADELAAAASLVMGQKDEKTPIVHVRGFPYPLRKGTLREMLRPEGQDLFR